MSFRNFRRSFPVRNIRLTTNHSHQTLKTFYHFITSQFSYSMINCWLLYFSDKFEFLCVEIKNVSWKNNSELWSVTQRYEGLILTNNERSLSIVGFFYEIGGSRRQGCREQPAEQEPHWAALLRGYIQLTASCLRRTCIISATSG